MMHDPTHIKIPTLYFSVLLKPPKKDHMFKAAKFSKSVRGLGHIVV